MICHKCGCEKFHFQLLDNNDSGFCCDECKTKADFSKEEFIEEFYNLLKKYNVEITARDEWSGYPECGEDIQISFYFKDKWWIEEFQVGDWIDIDHKIFECLKE